MKTWHENIAIMKNFFLQKRENFKNNLICLKCSSFSSWEKLKTKMLCMKDKNYAKRKQKTDANYFLRILFLLCKEQTETYNKMSISCQKGNCARWGTNAVITTTIMAY